ncbi:MAG TPA: SIS domain-containing protein [Acidimicrobiales bacterium]|nr:SIS domain-containing protein [Acidimicrobiales bacterium]
MADGSRMAAELAEQPRVLAAMVSRWPELVSEVARVVPGALAGIAFVGRGSSDNAAVLGRYAAECAGQRPAGLVAPSVHTLYQADVDYSGYLVVALSQSGETPEIVATAELLSAAGAKVVAITNDPDSALASVGDVHLDLAAGTELAVPATKTVSAQMLAVLAVAEGLRARRGRAPLLDDAAVGALPDAVDTVLSDPGAPEALATRWSASEDLVVVARGVMLAAALEVALKVRETAGVFAQGSSTADLAHGPIASIAPGAPVLVLDGGGPGVADVRSMTRRLTEIGADVVVAGAAAGDRLTLAAGVAEPLQVLVATVRGQQLALAWALARRLDPDTPAGLTKVTLTR